MAEHSLKHPAAILGFCGVLASAIFGWMTASKSAVPDLLEAMSQANNRLRDRVEQRDATIERLTLKIAEQDALYRDQAIQMQVMQLQASVNLSQTPRQTIRSFLNGITTHPAWCNEWKPEEQLTRMLVLNTAYQGFYAQSAAGYEGRTHKEIWGEEVGGEYLANDLKVIEKRSSEEVTEPVKVPGHDELVPMDFVKFWVQIPASIEMVCGIQILSVQEARAYIAELQAKAGAAWIPEKYTRWEVAVL